MLRPIALADSISISLMKGPNWAAQPAVAASSGGRASFSAMSFLWRHLRLRGKEVAWIAKEGGRITSLVSAIPASGNTAWWIDHMVVGETGLATATLLGKVTAEAGRRGAERVLLTIPDEWQLMDSASRGGFRPSMEVRVLTLGGRAALIGEESETGFRPRAADDDIPLFDLYRRTTPAEARFAMGLTMSQWKDSQESPGSGTAEHVLDGENGIAAWVRLDRERRRVRVRLTVDPSWKGDPRSLIGFVLAETGSRSLWWEVLGHQESLGSLLEQIGLETAGVYHLMVKALAVHVEARDIAPAHAAYG